MNGSRRHGCHHLAGQASRHPWSLSCRSCSTPHTLSSPHWPSGPCCRCHRRPLGWGQGRSCSARWHRWVRARRLSATWRAVNPRPQYFVTRTGVIQGNLSRNSQPTQMKARAGGEPTAPTASWRRCRPRAPPYARCTPAARRHRRTHRPVRGCGGYASRAAPASFIGDVMSHALRSA
eukprot:COSAG01_NODE_2847_length_6983_cov_7.853574_6_plen_177_part_00